jgi:diguanylate cyclase (GGDEF)-like protein
VQGDEALKAVAATLQRHARRPYDLAARFGGEEFALILPGEGDAPAMAEHFRQEVLRLSIAHAASPTAPQLTVSCGVLTVRQPSHAPLESWLQKVDELLYQAKTQGRNRIAAAAEP